MKKIYILFLLLSITAFLACNKDDNNTQTFDYEVKKNNIIGDWDVTWVIQEIRADTLYHESAFDIEVTFNANQTGVRPSGLVDSVSFDWYYQYEPERVIEVVRQSSGPILILDKPRIYRIIKNEKDKQIWEFTQESATGVADEFRHTWKMKRK